MDDFLNDATRRLQVSANPSPEERLVLIRSRRGTEAAISESFPLPNQQHEGANKVKVVPITTEMKETALPTADERFTSSDSSDLPWDPNDPEQWDFAHGPRFGDWIGRTGEYLLGASGMQSSSRPWSRAVPALAWAEGDAADSRAHGWLESIRLVVVDRLGVRRPCPGDPLEEAVCRELTELFRGRIAQVEAYGQYVQELEDELKDDPGPPSKEYLWAFQASYEQYMELDEFLQVRDLGDARLVVAFGPWASFAEDYDTLQQTVKPKDSEDT
jgi:hypothetical protein